MTDKQNKIIERALIKYGSLEQCLMAMEEAGELIQAINKLRRLHGIGKVNIFAPGEAPIFTHSTKYALAYNDLCGEVADMEIMLAQMRKMLNEEQIDLIKERKINRLEERMNG